MLPQENAKLERSGEGEKITLVLLGNNSNDKAMIGNALLKAKRFTAEHNTCTRAEERVDNQTVCVINAPDLLHKSGQETDDIEEIKTHYPGPCAFLLVLENRHLSQEDTQLFSQIRDRFGEKAVQNTIVVLVNRQEKRSGELHEQADENLKKLLDECGQRMCVYDEKKDNELTIQVVKEWRRIQEKQVQETSNYTPVERIYEEINLPYEKMNPINEAPWGSENSKADMALASGGILTVVLLGKISNNKCLVGNTIFHKDHFRSDKVTCERIVDDVDGEKVCIINTPDLFHEGRSDPDAERMAELKPSYAGPRVFLLVLQDRAVSPEDMHIFTELKNKLGQKMVEQTIVLVNDDKKVNSIDTPLSFKDYNTILNECGNRQCVYSKHMKNTELIKQLKKYKKNMNQTPETDRGRGTRDETATANAAANYNYAKSSAKPLTVVLLGQTGSGKSATGNTILKKHHFESHASSVPVTTECQTAEETVYDTRIRVIDTPDFFNEDLKDQEEQIKWCRELAQPGPDVYLLVMQLGRFTEGEREVLPRLKREFGDDVTSKTVILFTSKEKLKHKTLTDYIDGTDRELQDLIKACHSRYYAFNNNNEKCHQVKRLLEMISDMQKNSAKAHRHSLKKKHKDIKECSIL